MFKITPILCTLLFATVTYASTDAFYLNTVRQVKSIAGPKIENAITKVTEVMNAPTSAKEPQLIKLYEGLLNLGADGYKHITDFEEKVKQYVATTTNKTEKNNLLKCFGEVDKLHESAKSIIDMVNTCAWNQTQASNAFANNNESIFNNTIAELNQIKDTIEKCDANVGDVRTALEAIICIKSEENKAIWKSTKFSIMLLNTSENEAVEHIIDDCSTTHGFPSIQSETKVILTNCTGYINGK